MKKRMIESPINRLLLTFMLLLFSIEYSQASLLGLDGLDHIMDSPVQDTIGNSPKDTLDNWNAADTSRLQKRQGLLDIGSTSLYPHVSLQQMLKGNIAGLYVKEPTAEPGSNTQQMFVRGVAAPAFSLKDLNRLQPTVYVNGIPLIQDHSFLYNTQQSNYSAIGPGNNLLATLNLSNIASIEVVKDLGRAGMLGPRASNGAILITTKNAESGTREISVNSYFGMVQRSPVFATNAQYENDFRKPFYNKYAGLNELANYPGYLADSSNASYYGPSNWTDAYYNNASVYSISASISGGSERSNFRFFGEHTKNSSGADASQLNRYKGVFYINMLPVKWLTISSMINATRLDRDRNRTLRSRFAEMRYMPDITNPLPPNNNIYQNYLNEYDKAIDINKSNSIQGSFGLKVDLDRFQYNTRIAFDYNEGIRDVFWPSTLFETNNYVSNFYGYNQRFIIDNTLSYQLDLDERNGFLLQAGQSYNADIHSYNYNYGYKGSSDFIKIDDDEKSDDFISFRNIDRIKQRLMSFYGKATYDYADILSFSGLLRSDASSNMQPGSRWLISSAVTGAWNIGNTWEDGIGKHKKLSSLSLDASWGKMGNMFFTDRYAAGPQYASNIGWTGNGGAFSYNGFGTLSRPYSTGWIGYDISWPYTEMLNLGLNAGFFNNKLNLNVEWYNKNSKNMMLAVPAVAESGYSAEYQSGLWVNNRGLDFSISAALHSQRKNGISYYSSVNVNYNQNKLKALPGGLNELQIGNQKLTVGHPVGQFWLLQNEGIYKSDQEVPQNPETNEPLSYKGTAFKGGDPIWKDVNGDHVINDEDKMLEKSNMPKFSGGWSNRIEYANFSLDFQFYFALGQYAINQEAAHRYGFANVDENKNMGNIKEITYWSKDENALTYPLYNPWSPVQPYQANQDLFLEDASFVKLRSISLGYDFSSSPLFKSGENPFKKVLLYVSASNLFTITNFSGQDPEMVNYSGYYSGYGQVIPKTYTIGFKLDF